MPDFDTLEIYAAIREVTRFIGGLEDRFPADELGGLYARLNETAVAVGAALAAGYGRDGLDDGGNLSAATARDVRGRLGELKHYVLAAESRYYLDEAHVSRFTELYERIRAGLPGGAGS
ncbi:MAG TPA: four helix bundle protein [Candidatus Polarisedimenticolia bacterium]|nr:four helix bundle protein [Candidatus Polarisedimenticolia bacterium]